MSTRHNDMRRMADALVKLEASSDEYDGDKRAAAVTLIRRTIPLSTAATNANASNAIAANASPSQHRMLANGRVLGCYFLPSVATVEHATNNAQISAVKLAANGAVSAYIATANTNTVANGGTGTLAPGVAITVGLASVANASNIANIRFTKGQVLAPIVAQNASGVAMGVGTIELDVELEGPADDYAY